MAITIKQNISVWELPNAEGVNSRLVKIAASQGAYIGDSPAYVSTSGTAKRAVTSASGEQTIHGFLAVGQSSELSANTEVIMNEADRDIVYAIYAEDNTSDTTLAQSNVGNQYGMTVQTSTPIGYATMDINSGTYTIFDVIDIASNKESEKHTTSDSPGVGLVKIRESVLAATHA